MSPTSPTPGPVRPAAVVNEDIRRLWAARPADTRVQLVGEQRAEYERLVVEWAAAVRAEIIEAA